MSGNYDHDSDSEHDSEHDSDKETPKRPANYSAKVAGYRKWWAQEMKNAEAEGRKPDPYAPYNRNQNPTPRTDFAK